MLGTGTALNPYLIETPQDWEQVRLSYTNHFKLANDLDFAGATFAPINFSGTLDGDGHVLRNMIIRSTSVGCGVFGTLSVKGTIRNLGIENIDSKLTSSNAHTTSSLVGLMIDDSLVENCYVKDSLIQSIANNSGALIGVMSNRSIIRNSYALNCTVSGKNYSASLIGHIGHITNVVENCYANSIMIPVPGTLLNGGLVSNANSPKKDVRNSYFDVEKAPPTAGTYINGYDGIPITPAQMKQQSSYVGFDFNTVWGMTEYPYLKVFGEILPPALSGEESVTSFMNPISSTVKTVATTKKIVLIKSHLSPIESSSISKFIPAPKNSTQSVTAYVNEIESSVSVSSKQSKTVNVSSYSDKIGSSIETKRIAIVRTIKSVASHMQPITAESNSAGKRMMINYVSSHIRSLQGYSVSSIHRPYKHVLAYSEVIVDGSGASWKVNESSLEHKPLFESKLYVVEHNSKTSKQDNLSYTEVIE